MGEKYGFLGKRRKGEVDTGETVGCMKEKRGRHSQRAKRGKEGCSGVYIVGFRKKRVHRKREAYGVKMGYMGRVGNIRIYLGI